MVKHGRGSKAATFGALAGVFLLCCFFSSEVLSQTVNFEPVKVVLPKSGETFSIDLTIEAVTNFGGFELTVGYDPAVVKILGNPPSSSVTLGNFIGSTGRSVVKLGGNPDNTAGTPWMWAPSPSGPPAAGPDTAEGNPQKLC
jgi:hypothetical protein